MTGWIITADSEIGRLIRDLRSFVIRFDFESYVRFEIRFVLMVRFEIFQSSALSIVIRKETIGGG